MTIIERVAAWWIDHAFIIGLATAAAIGGVAATNFLAAAGVWLAFMAAQVTALAVDLRRVRRDAQA